MAGRLRVIAANGAIADRLIPLLHEDTPPTASLSPLVAGAATRTASPLPRAAPFDIAATSDGGRALPPTNGTLVNVAGAGLGVDVSSQSAIDIAGGDNGLVLAALRVGITGPYSLYTVSLTTGAATLYPGGIDATRSLIGGAGGPAIVDLAIRY